MACMAYVDLNPIRAKMAETPEESDYTSIQQRIHTLLHDQNNESPTQPIDLYPFAGNPKDNMPDGIPFRLEDYIALVDWTGKQLHEGKRGKIDSSLPEIISRLGIEPENWQYLTTKFEESFTLMAGHPDNVEAACTHLGKAWTRGIRQCRQLFQRE